ncbi:MAG: hypothetical protein A3E78_06990 [Alphaproteobacteria bacterium RIFCSPHIGHO2_12_FULL_63_12]|nr:MAG: hypothetical protein A3E78_06990 [Alphaproteobacteria bacterium RIFCSPHIGHO2_12_FULL_63_12]
MGGVAIPAVAAASLYSRPKNAAKSRWASQLDRQSADPAADAAEPPVAPSSSAGAVETRRV